MIRYNTLNVDSRAVKNTGLRSFLQVKSGISHAKVINKLIIENPKNFLLSKQIKMIISILFAWLLLLALIFFMIAGLEANSNSSGTILDSTFVMASILLTIPFVILAIKKSLMLTVTLKSNQTSCEYLKNRIEFQYMVPFEIYNDEIKYVDGRVVDLTTNHKAYGLTVYKTHKKVPEGEVLYLYFKEGMIITMGKRNVMEKIYPFL